MWLLYPWAQTCTVIKCHSFVPLWRASLPMDIFMCAKQRCSANCEAVESWCWSGFRARTSETIRDQKRPSETISPVAVLLYIVAVTAADNPKARLQRDDHNTVTGGMCVCARVCACTYVLVLMCVRVRACVRERECGGIKWRKTAVHEIGKVTHR